MHDHRAGGPAMVWPLFTASQMDHQDRPGSNRLAEIRFPPASSRKASPVGNTPGMVGGDDDRGLRRFGRGLDELINWPSASSARTRLSM